MFKFIEKNLAFPADKNNNNNNDFKINKYSLNLMSVLLNKNIRKGYVKDYVSIFYASYEI